MPQRSPAARYLGRWAGADPRQIKAVLQEAGITCWIDIENVGKEKKGIFADMAAGMRNNKMMLACISDKYADSDNCMMELRFGILNMELPLVVAVMGTGNVWEESEGWHMCDGMFPLAFRNRDALETFFKKITPYLYRIYSILKQGPIKLKCFVSGKGDAFHSWIQSESEESHTDFVGTLSHLRSELVQDEASTLLNCLARCRLPSGKIVWLCPRHQKWEHVSKLSTRSIGAYNIQKVLFSEDKLLMENLEKSAAYKKLKAIKSTKVAPKLPPPIPMPTYEPKASMMKEEPKPRPPEPQKEEIQDEDAMKEEPKPELNKPSEPRPNPNLPPLTDKDKSKSPNEWKPSIANTLPPPAPSPKSRSPVSSANKNRQVDRAELKRQQSMVVKRTGADSARGQGQGRRKSSSDTNKASTTCSIQ